MGFGGNLIWTGVLDSIHRRDGAPPVICKKPGLSDLLRGVLWDRATSLKDDHVFRFNPKLKFTEAEAKSKFSKSIDQLFLALLRLTSLKRHYERWVHRRSHKFFQKSGERLVHVDMEIHSYAEAQTSSRMLWKKGGHAAQIIARGFGIEVEQPRCELFFSEEEEEWLKRFRESHRLIDGYLVIEPGTHRDWFGELRAWPHSRWKQLVKRLNHHFPALPIVQLGLTTTLPLEGVIDLRGKTSFREAALILKSGALFLGTEGGLMHASRATGVPSVIIWGGVTLPEFAGYADVHKVICHYVPCAPCGNLGWCNQDHICMSGISVEEVFDEVLKLI